MCKSALLQFTQITQAWQFYLPGSVVHEKVYTQLTKTRLVNAIKQASPISQTSCLEGFHSVLNHFSPKMIHYSYPGMYCRYSQYLLEYNCISVVCDILHLIYIYIKFLPSNTLSNN